MGKKWWPEAIHKNYYEEDYREQHSTQSDGTHTTPHDHFDISKEMNAKQYQFIKPYLTSKTKFLEIGSSFGGLLTRTVKKVKECHAVEPNLEDVKYVREKHPTIKMICSKLEDAVLENNYYDVVASIEVLEHMVSVKSFLETCCRVLKPGGNLILEVPNHNDVLRSCYNAPAYKSFYYHKSHIHYFTQKSLVDICRNYGFEGEVSSFQVYPFFNHVNWCTQNAPQMSGELAMKTPLPTDGSTEIKRHINESYKKVEEDYDSLINEVILGGELIFRGVKV